MKRLFSFMMALVLVLSLGVTAFAAENESTPPAETGSITVTNATKDKVYSVYKIFNASISEDGKSVSYTLDPENVAINNLLFAADGTPTTDNKYFVLNKNTNGVSKAEGVNDSELTAYLQKLINENTSLTPVGSKTATDKTVAFTGLPYGYYVVKSTLGATVTINSNTPTVSVIDKNQQGGTGFNKQIKTGEKDGAEVWDDSNSACFGETVKYKMTFTATNYDGAHQTNFYSVYDTTGDAISPKFETITVKVGEKKLEKGYYIGTGDYATTNRKLGNWEGEYKTQAEWYLVQSSEDEFRISIPWMTQHTLNGNGTDGYSLSFGTDAESKFDSPVTVEITYEAVVEDNATIGGASYNTTNSKNINTAHVKWYFTGGTDSTLNDTVHTYVYGIGVLKEDSSTFDNLAGAEFEVYKDKACTQAVKFSKTEIHGVYNHDEDGAEATNKVVSQANGKIVLLGLKAGEYYLKEVKAPDGYNALAAPVEIVVGEGLSEDFAVYADGNGNVADTEQDVAGFVKHTYGVAKATVGNSKGVELPSTGGEGTMMMITIGTMIAMAFAVLLITHKKMSIYHD